MIPTRAVFERMLVLLGADTLTFNAEADEENNFVLVKAIFNPTVVTVPGDLTLADFNGYAARNAGNGAEPQSVDPATGDSLLDITPAEVMLWETTGTANLPQTIYGYALVNSDNTVLLASALLQTPVVLSGINQSVALPRTFLRQFAGSVV